VKHRARAEAVHWTAPLGASPQIDRIVISVREPEPEQHAAGCVQPERVDELLSHETHRGRAEDDYSLLVQPDDALIGPEIEQLREVQVTVVGRVVARLGLHGPCHSMVVIGRPFLMSFGYFEHAAHTAGAPAARTIRSISSAMSSCWDGDKPNPLM
jgi:hypothetical protein